MLLKCRKCKKIFKEEELKLEGNQYICPNCGYNLFSVVRLLDTVKRLQGTVEEREPLEEAFKEFEFENIKEDKELSGSKREKAKAREEELPLL